ncbi:MAG: WxL domain-containing protein [Bacillota bacterium]
MRLKKTAVLFVSVFLITCLSSFNVLADERRYQSSMKVEFEQSYVSTPPVDPMNPGDPPPRPIDPLNPDGDLRPGTTGSLTIDYASTIYFEKQTASGNDQWYYAKPQKILDYKGAAKEVPNYVQVTDNRGTNSGWVLQVKQDRQLHTVNDEELTGAVLSLTKAVPHSLNMSAPTSFDVQIDKIDQNYEVMVANHNHGMGTWVNKWGENLKEASDAIRLYVPGETPKKLGEFYFTTLTWTLSDTPH